MAWCQTGNKPLHESVMIQFTDTYISQDTSELFLNEYCTEGSPVVDQ